jgi:hypothetical protein
MIWYELHFQRCPSFIILQHGEPRCIDSLSQWLDFWIRCPTTWALKSAGTVWPGPFLNCEQSGSEVLLLLLLTAISAWSMFSTNSPWSSVSGFLRNMTCIIMIHHDSSIHDASLVPTHWECESLIWEAKDWCPDLKQASASILVTSPCPLGNCLTPAHRTSWYY